MSDGPPPWEVGDEQQRWDGYLDQSTWDPVIGGPILRNQVGATSWDELRTREDAAVGMRAMTLRAHGIPAAFDLDGLRSIHRHLFQDVYAWAGEVRTVNLAKGWPAFAPPEQVAPIMHEVAEALRESDNLRILPGTADVAGGLARVYDVINTAHPFREGNGRTQREFLTALAAESGHRIDWAQVAGGVNDMVSESARQGDLGPMVGVFELIVERTAARPSSPPRLPGAIAASYPRPATDATRSAPGRSGNAAYRQASEGRYGVER